MARQAAPAIPPACLSRGAPSRAILADWAFVRRPHAFRAARQAAPAIPPACLLRGAPSRAGAWREIVLRFCANYISYYWICKKSFLQISGFRYFARSFLFNSQISSCKFRISASAKKPFLQILKFFSYARNCLSERHIKPPQQCRLRGASSRPGNAACAAHTKSPRQYHPRGTHKVVPIIPPARHINLPVRLPSAAPHQISTPAARISSRLLRCTSAFAEDVQSDKTIVR